LEAVRLHLDTAAAVRRGRVEVRTEGSYQLGMDPIIDDANPDRPIDGTGRTSADPIN
jgi:formyltetrahydrofolate deformylase